MKKYTTAIALAIVILSSCKKETVVTEHEGTATIKFDAKAGSEDFALDKNFTLNNRIYKFSLLRYWISNVSLVTKSGEEFKIPSSYFLVEETKEQQIQDAKFTYPATKREDVELSNIPVGEYKTIKFSIGVDQKYNDNLSLQSGELSQLNGMTNVSWMWHTTYIFSALAGTVTEGATTKDLKVETGLNANYKTLSLDFPTAIKISSEKNSAVTLALDISKVIDGIDLMATPTIGAAQTTQMSQVANNYATKSFTVVTAQ